MDTIAKTKNRPSAIMSKPVLMEVVKEYGLLLDSMPVIIKESGYKAIYLAKRLDMPITTFHHKKRKKTFTYPEVQRIIQMLNDDDELEDAYFREMAESRANDEVCSFESLMSV
ncbi:MAG: hypothetical protein LBU62_08430 [Bacteroidales bacterium]|jgi:hypothetical protein|nr:hypothetical protein [Bacteroidales bacterium]